MTFAISFPGFSAKRHDHTSAAPFANRINLVVIKIPRPMAMRPSHEGSLRYSRLCRDLPVVR